MINDVQFVHVLKHTDTVNIKTMGLHKFFFPSEAKRGETWKQVPHPFQANPLKVHGIFIYETPYVGTFCQGMCLI